jgi:hypothetical protein
LLTAAARCDLDVLFLHSREDGSKWEKGWLMSVIIVPRGPEVDRRPTARGGSRHPVVSFIDLLYDDQHSIYVTDGRSRELLN